MQSNIHSKYKRIIKTKLNPLINILIRTHRRPELLKRAVDSIHSQTYKNWNIIASYHDEIDRLQLIQLGIRDRIQVEPDKSAGECWFNLFLNNLKEQVFSGWITFMDSDNYFHSPNSLQQLSEVLTDKNEMVLTQFIRRGRIKPTDELMDARVIRSGKFDTACIAIHHSQKGVLHFNADDNADYQAAFSASEKIKTSFHKIKFIESDRRSRGQN